ncbi:anti-virulence regulator CigR family protein [uncultured Rheinheimera sp.]|uniref:anti-virulence regulator CigR family protein n=1 Tax=uncultured Rheinheimera sp. TaxID=400532 RepID=UPI00259676CE|nr:anti-virulence regulator CigR family protein [uncultured Rheinheimera sp.]
MNARTTLWVALIAPLLTQQVNAADADKDHQHKAKAAEKQLKQQSKQKIVELKPVTVSAGISLTDARSVAQRYQMTGQTALPSGIRKNLAKGKPLPPGIAKKSAPAAMLAELPQHQGYEWQVVGTDLILVSIATAVIADVLVDVLH